MTVLNLQYPTLLLACYNLPQYRCYMAVYILCNVKCMHCKHILAVLTQLGLQHHYQRIFPQAYQLELQRIF